MKTLSNCYVFVYDQYSDWEPALATYILNNFAGVQIITFSLDGKQVTSGGNLKIQPQLSLAEVLEADIDLLLIPGGSPITKGGFTSLLPLIRQQLAKNKTLAAICDATALLAQHGFLDTISHTGNNAELMKMMAPGYKGMALYRNEPAVTDGNVITAAGTAMVPFTREILSHFNLLENEQVSTFFGFFQGGDMPDITDVLPLHFFYRRYETTLAGLLPLVRTAIKEIYKQAIAADLEICGGAEWHYHNFDGNPETVFTLDIGLPVTGIKTVQAPYHCETLPGFSAVSLVHRGSWEHLGDTYGKLLKNIALLEAQPTGHNREQYFRYNFEQPVQNLTNVCIGIAKP